MSSRTILCQVKRAEDPFYLKDIDVFVYSIEELCYYIDFNLPLIDERFFDKDLDRWLRKELGLTKLADTLEMIREDEEEESDVERMIYCINAEINWIYAEDKKIFAQEIADIRNLPGYERMRRKADALVGYRKLTRAIETYRRIFLDYKEEELADGFKGLVYHNMGVTYARLFQFDEACDCLKKAYSLLHSSEALKNYLFCVRLDQGEETYENLAKELAVDPDTKAAMDAEIANLKAEQAPDDIDAALSDWVREYHRETGV